MSPALITISKWGTQRQLPPPWQPPLEATAWNLKGRNTVLDANLLTVTEVAALLRVSEQTVYRMTRAGKLAGATRVGNSWRFDSRRLDAGLFGNRLVGSLAPKRK